MIACMITPARAFLMADLKLFSFYFHAGKQEKDGG